MLYVIEFSPKFHHAQYYLGHCVDSGLARRVKQHLSGNGAKIIKAALSQGIKCTVVYFGEGDKRLETKYKRWSNNSRVLKALRKRDENV